MIIGTMEHFENENIAAAIHKSAPYVLYCFFTQMDQKLKAYFF